MLRLALASAFVFTVGCASSAPSTAPSAAALEGRPVDSGGRDSSMGTGVEVKVTGRVTDMQGSPLSKVTVSTNPPTTTAITGDEGRFSLGIPKGAYSLVITDASGEVTEQDVDVSGDTELGDLMIDAFGDAAANPTGAGGEGRPVDSGGRDGN